MIGVYEITTPEAVLSKDHTIRCILRKIGTTMKIWARDVHYFSSDNNMPYHNILRCGGMLYNLLPNLNIITSRKWNRLCVSYDFQKNQAQVAFSGTVSELIIDPETGKNMNGWDEEFLRQIFCLNVSRFEFGYEV